MTFQPGQSGNPKGRKPEAEFRNALRMSLAEKGKGDRMKALRKLTDKLISEAEAGEAWALKEVADRLDGKPPQAVQLGGEDGGPLQVVITKDDDAL